MFLPITQSALMQFLVPSIGGTFAEWKDVDLAAIDRCDELWVIMMKGWGTSVGVCAEIDYARGRMPIKYIDHDSLQIIANEYPIDWTIQEILAYE